jgi:hypothetical protein
MFSIVQFRSIPLYEKVHPLQGGFIQRKIRTLRRPGLPRETALLFYPRRLTQTVATLARTVRMLWQIDRIRRRVVREARVGGYSDLAIHPLPAELEEPLEVPEDGMSPSRRCKFRSRPRRGEGQRRNGPAAIDGNESRLD